MELIPDYLKQKGLFKEQLNSFNDFARTGIKNIVLANQEYRSELRPECYFRYVDVRVDEPSYRAGVHGLIKLKPLTPRMCRICDMTYSAPIYVNIKYKSSISLDEQTVNEVVIGYLPIMVKSCCCLLHAKDQEELAVLDECPLDPGGYFVIKGKEKVLLIQEDLTRNRIIVDSDDEDCVQASVICNNKKIESRTIITMEGEKFYAVLDCFKIKVPIMIIMKAMGMDSDQEVVQMLGRDPKFGALLLPSIEECAGHKVHSRHQALKFLERNMKAVPYPAGERAFSMLRDRFLAHVPECAGHKVHSRHQALKFLERNMKAVPYPAGERAFSMLRDRFLAHVPVHGNNFHKKCTYVAVMLRRIMEAMLNKDAMDDKDYMGNKRFELSGQLLSSLFENQFKTMNDDLLKRFDKNGQNWTKFDDHIDTKIITLGLERGLSTGNWAGSMMHRTGSSQVVSRLSFIGLLSHMTKIAAQFGKSRKVNGPSSRALHSSQWGMLCPCDTPEGEACGLMKNLALLTRFTTDVEERPITSLCYNLGVEDLQLLSPEEIHMPSSYLIILNGLILGKHKRPQKFANNMRKLRRNGRIGEFVSIFVNEKQGCVYIASDGGRVCRPLIVAEKGVSRIREDHLNELRDGVRDFDSFIREGLIEYLDVNEQNNSLISLRERDSTPETTHIEIDPSTTLGVCAGLIPYPHHNPSPWNIYQCAMGKQAMGNIAYNQLSRMDKVINLLVYPQRPLLTTRTIELVGCDKLGAGQNSIVAVTSYDGYDINDAIVMNKASLDRGFGRCIVKKTYSDIIEKHEDVETDKSDNLVAPQRQGREAEIMQILDDDGLALPGEIIRPRDIFINKEVPDVCVFRSRRAYKGLEGEPSVVERVALYSDKMKNLCIKVMIRHTRRPEIGDKFSSRHGQKGVCGNIVQQEDLPFSESGISPDLIINPHGFPRMTVGKLIELLGSKAAALGGRFLHGTAFGEPNGHADTVEAISEALVTRGFSYCGKDFLYSGTRGSPSEAYIFMGPIYYQKLKQMVQDKMKVFPPARLNMLTRQPIRGLRVGEMERDCLIAYGASMLTNERLMLSSDRYEIQIRFAENVV